MVPLDHPRSSLDMISRFLEGRSFSDESQNVLDSIPCDSAGGGGWGCATLDPVPKMPRSGGDGGDGGDGVLDDDIYVVVTTAAYARAAAASPPRIKGTPEVGQDFATVSFDGVVERLERDHGGAGGGATADDWRVEYEVGVLRAQ